MIPPFLRRRMRDRLVTLIDARIAAALPRPQENLDDRWAAERSRIDFALQVAVANQANALETERANVRNLIETAGIGRDVMRRLALVERLLGLEEGRAAPDGEAGVDAALEHLLDTRLGQVEARLLSYLEGPFAERLADRPARREDAA